MTKLGRTKFQDVSLGNVLDVDQGIKIPSPCSRHHKGVGPAGKRSGAIAMFGEGCHCFVHTRGADILKRMQKLSSFTNLAAYKSTGLHRKRSRNTCTRPVGRRPQKAQYASAPDLPQHSPGAIKLS